MTSEAFTPGAVVETAGVCDSCGMLLWLRQEGGEDGPRFTIVHNPHCPRPTLSLWTDNPRKLGVITGLT